MIAKCPYCDAFLTCDQPEGSEVDCAACGEAFIAIASELPQELPVIEDGKVLTLKKTDHACPMDQNEQETEHAYIKCRICGRGLPLPEPYPQSVVCKCGHVIPLRPPKPPFYSRTGFRKLSLVAFVCIMACCAVIGGYYIKVHNQPKATRIPELQTDHSIQEPETPTLQANAGIIKEMPPSANSTPEHTVALQKSETVSTPDVANIESTLPMQSIAEVISWATNHETDNGANTFAIVANANTTSMVSAAAGSQASPSQSEITPRHSIQAQIENGTYDGAGFDVAASPILTPTETLDFSGMPNATPLQSIVTVETDMGLGHGTGFIVEHDGKKYILTNQHVIEALRQITFTLFDGTVLWPKTVEVNKSSDLARVDISGSTLPALLLETIEPNIKDEIRVYGDSGGEKVFTELTGRILGVGPDKLEVSADFIPGNSGSPIISSRGRVLGVATYILTRADPSDYLLTGTRFAKPRRFGLRYDPQDRWVRVSTAELMRQHRVLEETERYLVNVLSVMFCWIGDPALQEKARAYFESTVTQPMTRHYFDTKWTEHISIFGNRYASYWKDRFRLHTDDGRLNRTQVMLGTILVALAEQPKTNLVRQVWVSDALKTRAKYLEEYMTLFTKECTAITKRAGWDRCVIEDALKRNRRPDRQRETPSYPFLYDDSTE